MSEWPLRVMVYGAGDAINGANALAPEIEAQLSRLAQVATNPYVAAIAQLDASDAPTQRYVLDPSGQQPVYTMADVDTGDPNALVDFVTWSAGTCPAQRSVLVLSGHGAAWEDAMVDQVLGTPGAALTRSVTALPPVPGAIHNARRLFGADVTTTGAVTRSVLVDGNYRDYLSNAQLGAACASINQVLGGKLDVLVFDACLMSAWEILQELSASVSAVVGSIDEISAAGIDMSGPVAMLSASSGAGNGSTIAATIAGSFQPQATFDSCVAIDLGNPNWVAALGYFRAFCAAFLPWVSATSSNADAGLAALRYAATSVVEFTGGGLADVGALASAVANIPGVPADAISNVQSAAAAVAACVLARSTGSDYEAAIGLSIFSPNSATVYATNRPEYMRLQFPTVTGWSAVLDALYGYQNDYARFLTPAAPPTPPAPTPTPPGDAEFVASLQGFPIDDAMRDQIEKAINRAVLAVLAGIDLLADVTITPPDVAVQTRGLLKPLPGVGHTAGLVIADSAIVATRGLATSTPTSAPPPTTVVQSSGSDFHVVLQGLPLDQATQAQIDAAIRAAVLQQIATIDQTDQLTVAPPAGNPQTRSLLGGIFNKILGLVLVKPPQV